jgi:hypothetical protein
MKTLRYFWLALAVLGGSASAQGVHNITWTRQAVEPGRVVTLGSQNFVLVRLPMREFSNGNKYVVEYLAPVVDLGPPVSVISQITTSHSNETITNPVTISGFPASIQVLDGRTYSYNANTGFGDGLSVDANVTGLVTIDVGDTMLTLFTFFSVEQQPLTAVPTDFAASSWATWGTYTDPIALVNNLDNWVDFIRVLQVP